MAKDTGLLFVYGTLKVDTGSESFARYFDGFRLDSKPASVKGVLYDMGYFPGLILGGDKTVYGELHRYSDFNNVIDAMDRVEGYFGKNDPHNLYNRVIAQVIVEANKASVTATLYEFADSVDRYSAILNGIWTIDNPSEMEA